MLIYFDEEFGSVIADECADCEHSYIDDLFHEWMCKRNTCKYTKLEQQQIIEKTKAEWQTEQLTEQLTKQPQPDCPWK